MERYAPLKAAFEQHGIGHQEANHERGPLLVVHAATESDAALTKLYRQLKAIAKEQAVADTAPDAPAEKPPWPWWKKALGLNRPQMRPKAPTQPVPDEQTGKAIKDSLQGGQGIRPREQVRQLLEKVAQEALPEYHVNVGLRSVTHGGYIVEARHRLNGS